MKILFLTFAIISLISTASLAYYTVAETGDLVEPDRYKVTIEPQLFFNPTGVNINGHIDTGIREDSSVRLTVGAGKTDFETSVSYKWIPIPDYQDQPAIGCKVGLHYARVEGNSLLATRFYPLISKKFDTEQGVFNPYASLPIGLAAIKDKATKPVQLVLGTEYKTPEYETIRFGAELGADLNEAFTYISAFIIINFDEDGFQLR